METLKNKVPFLVNLATTLTKNDKPVLYIAGKVTGLPVDEYTVKFKNAQKRMEAHGYKVLNPCDFIGPDESWETAMRMAATLLNMSDCAYFLNDWRESKGANTEFEMACQFGLDVIFE